MLLTAALIMGIMSTFTEVKLVHGSAAIRRLYTEGLWLSRTQIIAALSASVYFAATMNTTVGFLSALGLAYMVVTGGIAQRVFITPIVWNTVGSFVLSWIIGMLFSATGMTVMLGGVISTALSQAYFSTENAVSKVKVSGGQAKEVWNDFWPLLRDIGAIIKWTLRFITLPLQLARKGAQRYGNK